MAAVNATRKRDKTKAPPTRAAMLELVASHEYRSRSVKRDAKRERKRLGYDPIERL